MRKPYLLFALMLGLLALAACSAAGLPAPEAPTAPAPAVETPAIVLPTTLPAEYVGVYTASLPAADTPGRDITVALDADGAVLVTSDYLNGQPPIVETGVWSANPSGAVTVVLTAQGDQKYFEPHSYLVGLEGDELLVLADGGNVVRFARSTGEQAAAAPSGEAAPSPTVTETMTSTLVVTSSTGVTSTAVVTDVTLTEAVTATGVLTEEAGLANTYVALLPAASGGGTRLVALSLFQDGTAQLATEFASEEAPAVEVGTWVDNGDETFTLTLTGLEDRPYAKAQVVTFQRDGDFVQSIDAQDLYGSEGLRLRLAASVARNVSASLITLDLQAGFPLDPTFVSVQGGGEVDASLLSSQCSGFINRQPVVTVNWTGTAPYVNLFFVSDSDPTLAVLTPDGQLLCNDDTNKDLLDPGIDLSDPISGTYRIWVGSYAKGQLIPGVLVLTTKPEVNLGTFNLGGLIRRPLVAKVIPEPTPLTGDDAIAAATAEIKAPAGELAADAEPLTASLTVSGTIPVFQLDLPNPLCNGLVSGAPDYVFEWTSDGGQFSALFDGDADATLLVLSADGQVLACNDDAETGVNINPLVAVQNAPAGLYGVWVGRLDPSKPVIGTLTVTAAADAAPKVLAPAQ